MDNFDLLAENYDTKMRIERAKAIADEIRTHIIDGYKKSAIEFGCGTGLVGIQLINDFKEILFVDSSSKMAAQVGQKLSKLNNPGLSSLCCDFMVTVPNGLHADYIFSSLVLHHIKDTISILSRLYNILHEDGHLLIVDIDRDNGSFHANYPDFDGHNGFDKPALIDLTKKAGFSKVEINTFYHGNKVVDTKESEYSLFILHAMK